MRPLRDTVVEQFDDQLLLSERGKAARVIVLMAGDVKAVTKGDGPGMDLNRVYDRKRSD